MADETDTQSIEAEARELDWVPREEFQGDPEKWMDADAFLKYQRKLVPLVKETNKRLSTDVDTLKRQVSQLARQLEASQGDFETLQEFHNEEVSRRVEETRKSLLAQIKTAKREGDVDTEVDLQGQLSKLDAANSATEDEIGERKGANGEDKGDPAQQLTPEYLAWKSENPNFDVDPEFTYNAMAVAARVTKEKPNLRGKAFFDEVDRRLHGKTQRPGAGKVEGSRGGGSNSSSAERTYADLDAEARKQCDKYAQKFVKKDGKFPTVEAYRKHFIKELENTGYFS